MFTGIVEETGSLAGVRPGAVSTRLTISARTVLEGTRIGDSIAVNGVCLTVTDLTADSFSADVMAESLRRSNLGSLKRGDPVNLERALSLDTRLGGHLVSGHIDGTGKVVGRQREDNAVWFTIQAPSDILAGIVVKGSIAIDGISLTVVDVTEEGFTVSIIPHTMQETTLGRSGPGTVVNLENDIIGKYVQRFLQQMMGGEEKANAPGAAGKGKGRDLSLDFLAENGFL